MIVIVRTRLGVVGYPRVEQVAPRWIPVDCQDLRGICRTRFCCYDHDHELWPISGVCLTSRINVKQTRISHLSKFFWSLIVVVSVKSQTLPGHSPSPQKCGRLRTRNSDPPHSGEFLLTVSAPRGAPPHLLMPADSHQTRCSFLLSASFPIPSSRRVPPCSRNSSTSPTETSSDIRR